MPNEVTTAFIIRMLACAVILVITGPLASQRPTHHLPPNIPPVLGCWFWKEAEFEQQGYKPFLDEVSRYSDYDLLTTSLRAPNRELTDPVVHDQILEAARYAQTLGLEMVMDLDVRLAREAFRARYPDELQEMLRLREFPLSATSETVCHIKSEILNDHYTHNATPYLPLSGRVVRLYAYRKTEAGIDPASVQLLGGDDYRIEAASADEVHAVVSARSGGEGWTVCLMAAFIHLTPDVFAPHLDEFQAEVLAAYGDVPLKGACKDEWGFPPSFDGCPDKNDYWYSDAMAKAYADRTDGDLLRDCPLMTYGETGREVERRIAINQFNQMVLDRNTAIEKHFYASVKRVFGDAAVVATHPTWYPYPGVQEFKKNGLDWWSAPRDWAQTDELTPYAARTALAKKWNSPVWYNMYYSKDPVDYQKEIWRGALTGGRVNFHPPWPRPEGESLLESTRQVTGGDVVRGDCRIRLLNFITKSPLDCPVAVVFGHLNAMNWAGDHYADVGMGVVDEFWNGGFPADLIPSTEIDNGGLFINAKGALAYGPQEYAAVVLHRPEFESESALAFLQKVAEGPTQIYWVGDWTVDAHGKEVSRPSFHSVDRAEVCETVIQNLKSTGVLRQGFENEQMTGFEYVSLAPAGQGRSRLVDGTRIHVVGTESAAGDPLTSDDSVAYDGMGVVAYRLDSNKKLEALAAGGLKKFNGGGFHIELEDRIDLALWNENGAFVGVVQGWDGPIPEPLLAITSNWTRIGLPTARRGESQP